MRAMRAQYAYDVFKNDIAFYDDAPRSSLTNAPSEMIGRVRTPIP